MPIQAARAPSNSSLEHRLLEATATAANALLTIAPFDQAVNTALQIIGEALDIDRVKILEWVFADSSNLYPAYYTMNYEWLTAGTISQLAHPSSSQISNRGVEAFMEENVFQTDGFGGLLCEWTEAFWSAFEAVQAKAIYCVPIRVEGQLWGVLVFDDCHEAKRRNLSELTVLKIAANCIGSAIQCQRTQQAILEAEQARSAELAKANEELQQRDRLLSTVAAVSKDLLESAEVDSTIAQALQRIGEAAGISRMLLMRERLEASSGRLQHQVIQEWVAPNVPRQMDDPATKSVFNDEYGVLSDELHSGRSIWHTLDDFPEPAQTHQAGIEVKSTGAVPIFIEGEYFGYVGFDDCVTHRQWTTHEIDVLTTGAGAIGAALHRQQLTDRLVEERIQAAQERAAELAKTNEALQQTINALGNVSSFDEFVPTVLKIGFCCKKF